ncbi:2OG-Fe(II) oxygenase [Roseateles sp. L2-2]|uniref:2OG-Fe(II) oxygenase n=1 Tax=Roseateles sp. L2-2 TaxID=3422597 RepID=UPI003D35A9C8
MSVRDAVDRLDWPRIEAQLNEEGCAVLPGVLGEGLIAELLSARPDVIADLRKHFYERLVPTANHWNAVREIDHTYPDTLAEWMAQSGGAAVDATGDSAHSRLTRLRIDDYEPLRQYGERPNAFPLQLVALLNEPGNDFTGGEFVLTEQRPRMQSRPMVLPLRRGDVAVLAVAHRPHKGTKGYYRVSLKHAISRVRSGERVGIELLIDEATVA